ncbi:MAG: glycosyltransferase family 4 protein [Dissulfurispiraceae bacterium]|jgi:glycosyltransferase involved in cell wall biosynthesis
MRDASYYFYCDRTIEDGSKCVLLFGGFTGYQNFGDILQLKHAVSFHKSTTGLNPVVICDIACIPGPGYPEKLYERLGVDCIIYFSREYCDAEALHLKVIEAPLRIPYFHTYGGGFLNRYWVQVYLSLAPDIIDFFGVGHYLLSGQQVDRQVADRLKNFFEAYQPLLIGCRDEESFEAAKEIAPHAAAYSFDDAFEGLLDMTSCVGLTEDGDRRQTILLHLNLSRYSHDNETAREGLEVYKESLRTIKSHYADKELEVVLLIAYNDLRFDEVKDTLGVLLTLEDDFDFVGARIVNLANLVFSRKACGGLDVPIQIPRSAVLITTSYHTAMMGLVTGLRTYLFEENAYYRQKHAGLHLKEQDLKSFLEQSRKSGWSPKDRQYFSGAREKWHKLLSDAYRKEPEMRDFSVAPVLDIPQAPFVYKIDRKDLYKHIGNLDRTIINLETQIREKEKQIGALQSELKIDGRTPGTVSGEKSDVFASVINAPLREIPVEYRHALAKILIVSGIRGAPYVYRCLNMKEELYYCGYNHVVCKYVDEVMPEQDARDFNLIILNRACESPVPAIIELICRCKERGVIVVFSTDDLVTDHAIDEYLGLYKYLSRSELGSFHRGLDESRKILRLCDAAIATTKYLRTRMLPFNKNVYVLENALNDKHVKKAERILAGVEDKKRKRKDVVIGYFSGWIHDHESDFATVSNALSRVLQQRRNARLRIVGFLDIGEEFHDVRDRVEQVDFVPFEVLPELIADVDINIAPLADNPRKRSKSSIKFLEAGILGVPTVAADLDPYNEIIVHGEDGMLCSNEEEWVSHLSALIDKPKRRLDMGMKANAKVKAGHTTFMRSRSCRGIMQSIIEESCCSTHRPPDAAREEILLSPLGPEELTRKYIKGRGIRIGEFALQSDMQADIAASAGELSSVVDSKYDFLIAGHILQCCANPAKALAEFHRITKKHDSYIYLALPNPSGEVTPVSYFADEYFMRAPERKQDHVFTAESFLELLDFMDKELYVRFEVADRYSDDSEFVFILKPVY